MWSSKPEKVLSANVTLYIFTWVLLGQFKKVALN